MIYICIFFQFIFSQDVVYFNGDRAMEHLNYQCSFGPDSLEVVGIVILQIH